MRIAKRKKPIKKCPIKFSFLYIIFENCEVFRVKKEDCIVEFYRRGEIKSIFVEKIKNLSNVSGYPYSHNGEMIRRLQLGNDITGLGFLKNQYKNTFIHPVYLEKDPHVSFYSNLIQRTELTDNGIKFCWEDGKGVTINYNENSNTSYGCFDLVITRPIYEKVKGYLDETAYNKIEII